MKNQLRDRMRATLDSIDFFKLIHKSEALSDQFFNHLILFNESHLKNRAVVSFYPFSSEPQINIEKEAQNEPYRVAYVRVQDWSLSTMTASYARRDQPGQWEEKQFTSKIKIFQPTETQPECKTEEVAAILVPGLAFTRTGTRLGRGSGFYDRFLKKFPSALRVGVAFHEQICESLPLDEWDEPLDIILTDQGIFETKSFGQWQKQGKVLLRS